jgi:hypothetical protein
MLPLQFAFTVLTAVCFQAAASHQNTRSIGSLASDGCGKPLPHGQALETVSNVSISSGGFQRSYLLFIPPNTMNSSRHLSYSPIMEESEMRWISWNWIN